MIFISKEVLLNILRFPHISEKSSFVLKKNNVVVFNVDKHATKKEIKLAINNLFSVSVRAVHTLIIKGKQKKHGKILGRRNNWKKAYVTLNSGQKIDFSDVKRKLFIGKKDKK